MQAIAKMKDTMVDTVGELASGTADAAEEAADRAEEAKNCLKDAAEAKAAELKFLAHKAKHKGAQQATAQLRNAIAAAKAAEGFGSETLAEVDKLGQGGTPPRSGISKPCRPPSAALWWWSSSCLSCSATAGLPGSWLTIPVSEVGIANPLHPA